MTALVPELVHSAMRDSVSSTTLLRQALVVARRLDIPDLVTWITNELNGYYSGEVPDYRRLHGQVMLENPLRGPIPFFAKPEILDELTYFEARQSLPELETVAKSETGIFSHYPSELEHRFMQLIHESHGVALRPTLKFSTIQVLGIVEKVRSRVLEWALDLESKGVLGEGMTFSEKEKQIVQEHHNYFGNITGSQIQIGSDGSTQSQTSSMGNVEALSALIALLEQALRNGEVSTEICEDLQADLAYLQAQAASPKPKWPVIQSITGSIKSVLENAAGSTLATQAQPFISALLL